MGDIDAKISNHQSMNPPSEINLGHSRKLVRRAKLDALTPAQRATLISWLTVENVTYAVAKTRVAEQFGIVTNRNGLSKFYRRFCQLVTRPESAPAPGTVLAEFVVQLRIPKAT
jgi:hypothetical protein